MNPILMSAKEVAEFTGLGYDTALDLLKQGRIATVDKSTITGAKTNRENYLTTRFSVLSWLATVFGVPANDFLTFYKDAERVIIAPESVERSA